MLIVQGIASFIYASSLVDLKILMGTTIEQMALIFPIVCISFTAGSLLSGFIFRFVSRHISSVVAIFLCGLSVTLTPHSPNLAFLFAMAALKGLTSGIFNTSQVVWIMDLWQKGSGPYLQGLQFCISIGSFIAPLMNKPFLNTCPAKKIQENSTSLFTTESAMITLISETNRTDNIPGLDCTQETTIYIPYAIEGILALCGAVLLLILFFMIRFCPCEDTNTMKTPVFTISQKNNPERPKFFNQEQSKLVQIFYIANGFVIIGLYFGCELANFQLLATFTRYLNHDITGT